MTTGEKPRIAIGVFHDVGRLRAAIGGLLAVGYGEMLVLSEPGALGGRLARLDMASGDGGGPPAHVRLVTRTAAGIEATGDSAADDGSLLGLTSGQLLHFETWLASRFASDLDDHLEHGGCLLICPAGEAEREKAVTGILLKHAAGRVQLHDIGSAAG